MKRILYVLHSGVTGGTFLTNKDLMKNVESDYEVFLLGAERDSFNLYSFKDGDLKRVEKYPRSSTLSSEVNGSKSNFHRWNLKEFHNSWLTYIYFDILINYKIDIVHIRHLINHSFDLPQVARKLKIPVVLSMHDFYFICPFYVLLDENQKYCGGKCSDNDENCYMPMKSLDDVKSSKKFIPIWRENVLEMFSYIDMFVTTSNIVKDLFLDIYTDRNIINDENFFVIEHGRDFAPVNEDYFELPSLDKPIKILTFANNLNVMKGSQIIKNIKNHDKDDYIEFHFLGKIFDNLEEYGISHGTFERDEFYKKVKEIRPSFVGIFSIWPETFCHTLTEAWSCNIPVLGSNIGVIEDRIRKYDGGWIIDIYDSKKTYDMILNISRDKDAYYNVLNNIKNMKLKTTKEMSAEYLEIYEGLLNR